MTEQYKVALYAGMSNSLAQTLTVSNYVFTGLFSLEMVLKLFALGFFDYVADRFNCFDGVVVILSVVEIILDVSAVVMCFFCLAVYRICLVLHAMQLLKRCLDMCTFMSCTNSEMKHACTDKACLYNTMW